MTVSASRPTPDVLYPERPLDGHLAAVLDALAALPADELLVTDGHDTRVFSSPFSAALVACAVHRLPAEPAGPLVARCADRLRATRRPGGGWRFSDDLEPLLPVDLDDTACALAALVLSGDRAVTAADLESLLDALPGRDGGYATWRLAAGERVPGRENDVDVVVNTNLLYAAALLGRELPEVADHVVAYVEAHGLDCAPGSLYYRSPFGFAYFLARWLEAAGGTGHLAALRCRVVEELVERLARLPANPLDAAFGLVAQIALGAADRGLHRVADHLLGSRDDAGLWPAAPLFVDPTGAVYGAVQVTSAVAAEALYRYSRAGLALYRTAHHCPPAPRTRPGSLEDTLEPFAEVVPPALVSPRAFGHLRTICRLFPSALTSGFGMECRLADEEPRADLLLCVNAAGHGRNLLAGRHDDLELPATLQDSAAWRRIGSWCRGWAEAGTPRHQLVADFWLEFDLDRPPDRVPVPSVFFCTSPPDDDQRALYPDLLQSSLAELWGRTPSRPLREHLERCLAALPGDAYAFAVGAMLSRALDAARFCVKDLTPAQLPGYVEGVGWPGDRAALAHWLEWLDARVDRIHLDLDVGEAIHPDLGLECSFDGHRQPYEEPRWQVLLDDLVAEGLCTPAKRRALLAWPGPFVCRQEIAGETWMSCFDDKLSHVKLGLDAAGAVEVKAYIGSWRHYGNRVVRRSPA